MAHETGPKLMKTLAFGVASTALYWGMIHYAGAIEHFAHATNHACVVGQGSDAAYFLKPTAEACTGKGGHIEEGTWYFVLVPILIAFVMSYVHGAFTGLFWDAIGLKPKK